MVEKGHEEGGEEGEVQTRRGLLVRLLRYKFGKIPTAMVKRIKAAKRIDVLDQWFDQALVAWKLKDLIYPSQTMDSGYEMGR